VRERSVGVGFGNWIVNRTSGFFDAKLSRRSFIARATLLGSAVAVSGCAVVTRPGTPYARITDCGGNTVCQDGYTEFCCAINDGVNACPPGTQAAGWWRADYSVFCNGTRYYIDCNEVCCGPVRRDGFCAGCGACSCAHGCDTRKVHCNYFRYGQCNQLAVNVGPIACRMVTCVPPYTLDLGCTPSGAVDNSTANHFTDCARYGPAGGRAPSASVGSAVARTAGELVFAARAANHAAYIRRFIGGEWVDWVPLDGTCTSRVTVASSHPGRIDLFTRGADNSLFQRGSDDGVNWTGWAELGSAIGSDPAPVAFAPGLWVFVRVLDGGLHVRPNDGTTWLPWNKLGDAIASNPVPVAFGSQLFVFVRVTDAMFYVRRFDGTQWQEWTRLGGSSDADPGAVAFGAQLLVFQKTGAALQMLSFDGTTWGPWSQVAGDNVASSPKPVVFDGRAYVFVRGAENATHYRRWDGTTWEGWNSLGGTATAAPEPVVLDNNLYVFVRGVDNALYYCVTDGTTWSDWVPLGGDIDAVSAAG
jgi:hypothetical protein